VTDRRGVTKFLSLANMKTIDDHNLFLKQKLATMSASYLLGHVKGAEMDRLPILRNHGMSPPDHAREETGGSSETHISILGTNWFTRLQILKRDGP
jgi:hypothetical protein